MVISGNPWYSILRWYCCTSPEKMMNLPCSIYITSAYSTSFFITLMNVITYDSWNRAYPMVSSFHKKRSPKASFLKIKSNFKEVIPMDIQISDRIKIMFGSMKKLKINKVINIKSYIHIPPTASGPVFGLNPRYRFGIKKRALRPHYIRYYTNFI